MKRLYTDPFQQCAVSCVKLDDEEWEIQRVTTTERHRNRGLMRGVMKRVLYDADREGIVLLLTSGLGHDKGMSTKELVEWYCRLGFDAIAVGSHPGTTLMQRVPRTE